MFFSHLEQFPAAKFLSPPQAAKKWFFARVAEFRQHADQRRVLRSLEELRDRDPRLFEETGVSPDDLPPPRKAGVPLLTQTVLTSHFFGLHGK